MVEVTDLSYDSDVSGTCPRWELVPWHLPSWGFYGSHAACQYHALRFPSLAGKSPKCCKLAEPWSKSTSN